MEIHDVYKIDDKYPDVEVVYYGQWSLANGSINVPEHNIWKRRSNLKGHQFK